jgi:hypothetical protein
VPFQHPGALVPGSLLPAASPSVPLAPPASLAGMRLKEYWERRKEWDATHPK